jgi:integrase
MRVAKKPWYRRQDGYWYVQINGRQIKLSRSKQTAFVEFERLTRNRHDGEPSGEYALRQIISAYSQWIKSNLAVTTVSRRLPILESFRQSIPSTLRIGQLRGHHLLYWIEAMQCGPTTANTRITTIQGLCNWAVRVGYLDRNPIAKMDKPRAAVRQEFLPVDTWPQVLEIADGPFRDFLVVMLDCGARPNEMFTFEAKHYQCPRFVLPIADSKGRKRSRVVYLPEQTRLIVERLVGRYPEGKIFRNNDGRPWNADSINCRFRRLKVQLKMPWLCATTLRHSFAHHRLTSGQDALTVSTLLGHVDGRMLATRYGHLSQNLEFMKAAADHVGFPAVMQHGTAI